MWGCGVDWEPLGERWEKTGGVYEKGALCATEATKRGGVVAGVKDRCLSSADC